MRPIDVSPLADGTSALSLAPYHTAEHDAVVTQAQAMRLQGVSYRRIGRMLGVSRQTAWRWAKDAPAMHLSGPIVTRILTVASSEGVTPYQAIALLLDHYGA